MASKVYFTNVLADKCEEHDHEHCHCHEHADDKFHMLHPNTNWQAGLRYCEEIGVGTRDYELIEM